jgi:hypothetical protein
MGSTEGGVMADVLSKGRETCYKVRFSSPFLSLSLFLFSLLFKK